MNPISAFAVAGLLFYPSLAGADTVTEPLKIEFPKPQFQGTPVPVGGIKNLEKPGNAVKSIPVAKGSVLISKEKTVTSSETNPSIGDLPWITDGDKEGGDGSFVELGPGAQWVQIDLGAEFNISAVAIWHYHKQARIYKGVVVEVGSDKELNGGTIVFNNDTDNTVGKGAGRDPAYVETNHGRIVDAKGAKGRYVRLWSNGNHVDDLNHYVEVEVFGVPAK
ncbi:MAG: hypothetical protein ACR2OZ_08405 [Verrucomicrobiales bacterium]